MSVLVRAEIRAHPGRSDEVRRLAAALTGAAADEPGTLRYDWFTGAEPDTFVVVEEYTDPAAAVAHNEHCAALLAEFGDVSEFVTVALHGELDDALREWVAAHPSATEHSPL